MLEKHLEDFFEYAKQYQIEIYNEFSLQHELGVFLRNRLTGCKVQFERNIDFFDKDKKEGFVKKEIDICIFNENTSEKYAIELKFPRNGQHPEQMFAFIKDIAFMEQVKTLGFKQTLSLVLVIDHNFYSGQKKDGIYRYFRAAEKITGEVQKPTGTKDTQITVKGEYFAQWQDTTILFRNGNKEEVKQEKAKYYIVSI